MVSIKMLLSVPKRWGVSARGSVVDSRVRGEEGLRHILDHIPIGSAAPSAVV
jgi:hypothetical protein